MGDPVVIVGNCQAAALAIALRTSERFARLFDVLEFPAVHEIPPQMVPDLHDAVARSSVAILQRVEENYRDGIGLGTETLAAIASSATVIRWPSVFWGGYFPDLFYLRDDAGRPVVDGPFDYHDREILAAYVDGLTVEQTCTMIADTQRPSDAIAWADAATAELDHRGRGCDVNVTGFIAENFRDQLLFFTMNHPANVMLRFIGQEILRSLGLRGFVDISKMPDEVLGATFYPLHPNHVRALDLSFGSTWQVGHTPFKIRGVAYETPAAVRAFFDYYESHPELIAVNVSS